MKQPVLILHGGAGGPISAKDGSASDGQDLGRPAQIRKKISKILRLAYQRLVRTDALEAVTYAVRLLEDDPYFNAGTGSQLQADGRARLSASVMDGSRQRFAAVINLERIKNPVLVARALLNEKDQVLSGEGAFQYATKKLGLKPFDNRTPNSIKRWKKWKTSPLTLPPHSAADPPLAETLSPKGRGKEKKKWLASSSSFLSPLKGERIKVRGLICDTVGACALDRFGNLAGATSTGGRGSERPGRVSDSGMPVANFADSRCAISATGIGEEIIDEGLAIKIAARVQDGMSLEKAFKKTFGEINRRQRKIGAIGIDRKGNVAFAKTTAVLLYGWTTGKKISLFKI